MLKRLLNIREAGEFLNLKPSTLYVWSSKRKIKTTKLNGKLLFDREDLEEMIERSKRYIRDEVIVES